MCEKTTSESYMHNSSNYLKGHTSHEKVDQFLETCTLQLKLGRWYTQKVSACGPCLFAFQSVICLSISRRLSSYIILTGAMPGISSNFVISCFRLQAYFNSLSSSLYYCIAVGTKVRLTWFPP